jgi:hypothetical protein
MRGLSVLIVLCAVVAMLACSPALAGKKQVKNDAAVQAVQKSAAQKSVTSPATVEGVRCAGLACPLAGVVVTKEQTKQSARAIRVFFRQGVRLNCPLGGGCGK